MIVMTHELATKFLRAPDPERAVLVVGGRLGNGTWEFGRLQLGKPFWRRQLLFIILVGDVVAFLSFWVCERKGLRPTEAHTPASQWPTVVDMLRAKKKQGTCDGRATYLAAILLRSHDI